jgi:Putative addiction module component
MTITVDRLFQDSLLLSDESRLRLAERIVESVEPEESLLREQLVESSRRADELASGAVEGIPLDDALRHIRGFRTRQQPV